MNRKKILIFGPFGDFGGRELEAGFIANILSAKYDVAVCTSSSITHESQLFDFNKNLNAFSINDLIYKAYYSIKILSFFSYLKNKKKGIKSSYANNGIAKKYFNYNAKRLTVIRELLPKYDLLFICAQLTTAFLDEVIQIAKENNIKVVFRTTGAIGFSDYDFIDSVDCFIHHSVSNASRIQKDKNHTYVIIDQCAYNEKELLEIPISQKSINNFLILSRLSPEKGIEEIITYFLKVCSENDFLYIAGNGILESSLKHKYKESNKIKFQGFVDSFNVSKLFNKIDGLIIPSPDESGPLVCIEAMCAGKIIISTKVGAINERMQGTYNNYLFDYNDFNSFSNVFFKVKNLSNIQINLESFSLREKYKKEYSIKKITEEYLNTVDNILK
ncbi:MAG: glycosyltransferase [Lutibacter sp.]